MPIFTATTEKAMGLRFRKSVRLLPGVRLNISKQGLSSLSIGGRGLTYNIGRKGTRGTVGLPGSGLSYSHYEKHATAETTEAIDPAAGEITTVTRPSGGIPWVLAIVIALLVLGAFQLRGH